MKSSKIVKRADSFEIRYAFKSLKRHRTERFKSFMMKTILQLKTPLYEPI